MSMIRMMPAALILCGFCLADDQVDREKLWGTWTLTQQGEKNAPTPLFSRGLEQWSD